MAVVRQCCPGNSASRWLSLQHVGELCTYGRVQHQEHAALHVTAACTAHAICSIVACMHMHMQAEACGSAVAHVYELDVVQVAVGDGLIHLLILGNAVPEVIQRLQHNSPLRRKP